VAEAKKEKKEKTKPGKVESVPAKTGASSDKDGTPAEKK
jgi:hypothetical protein